MSPATPPRPSGTPTFGDSIASLRVLADELGWFAALRVGMAANDASELAELTEFLRSSEAFDTEAFDKGASDTDRTKARAEASIEQAAPAILLYRALLQRTDKARALHICGRVIATGALRFLGRQLHDLDPTTFADLDAAAREEAAQGWLERFFTSTTTLEHHAAEQVVFRVTACSLHRYAHAAGHPELAPLFCAADGLFFEGLKPAVRMDRPTTLAGGDDHCLFKLRFSDSAAAE